MDDDDENDLRGGGGMRPPPPPMPSHHLEPDDDGYRDPSAPYMSSLASEAYLAVRDFLSASSAEARGYRAAAAAHAAAAASRVQTAVEAEGALPRGDFGPVCDLLAQTFAWKAQALSDALDVATPTDAGGTACPSPTFLSASGALPPHLQPPTAWHQRPPTHHHQHYPYPPSHHAPPPPPPTHHHHYPPHPPPAPPTTAPTADGSGGSGSGEDAALEAELINRCLRRPAGEPADSHALARVRGLRDVKRELEDAVLLPGRLPPKLRAMLRGIRRPPRTFLLHGPPGTGKTLLVEAMAAAAGAALLCASPSAVLSKWSGESERAVRLLFRAARTLASAGGGGGNGGGGCIVFLDEVDALGASRGGGGGGGGGGDNQDALARRVLTELLVQMSRLDAEEEEGEAAGAEAEQSHGGPVWVFAATNRPEDVDPALLRRFERRLAVPLPDAEGRAAFVRAALEEVGEQGEGGEGEAPPLSEADVQRLVAVTAGLSGSDVRAVARRAALAPVRELAEQVRRRRGEAEEEEGEGKRQRRESGGGDGGDGALRLRAVRASDWEEAVAALFQR